MKFKLKGRTLLNADIKSPEISYDEFSAAIEPKVIKTMVETLNSGHEMLMLYKQYRDNLHISNMVEMVQKMEAVFKKYDYKLYEIRRQK